MEGIATEPFSHDPSATAAFAALPEASADERPRRAIRAVVIGGGTGAPVSIRTLLSMGIATDAVVAMADDGGSTGILRDRAGATAPGDIRKCITAMAGDADDPLTQAFKIRFGFAENHTLGNLMLSALEATCGNFPTAIAICEDLLRVRGHVFPSTLDRVSLVAETRDGRKLQGQAVASHSRTALKKVELESAGGVVAYQPAMDAIRASDLIVLGPGSLYTSIVPNLIVPGIIDSIHAARAYVVFVCSLADMQGETRGMTALEHYEALIDHGMEGLIDFMVVHCRSSESISAESGPVRDVVLGEGDIAAIRERGTVPVVADLVAAEHPTWHDPAKLRHAFAKVLELCRRQDARGGLKRNV